MDRQTHNERINLDFEMVNFKEVGTVVEGVYEGATPVQNLPRTPLRHQVRGEDGKVYVFLGTSQIDFGLTPDFVGCNIRLIYKGNRELSLGRVMKLFDLDIAKP